MSISSLDYQTNTVTSTTFFGAIGSGPFFKKYADCYINPAINKNMQHKLKKRNSEINFYRPSQESSILSLDKPKF